MNKKENKKTFFISTAIDYPSAKPHLGHCYERICADVIARWHRLKNETVHFSTGLDEHGLKIQRCAEQAGKKPQEYVNEMAKHFLELCKVYNISYDDFIRTTEERHKEMVYELFDRLYKRGDIYKGFYEGLYCVDCETFYPEDKVCPVHKRTLEYVKEESYFFRMSKYQDIIIKHIQEDEHFIIPFGKRSEILNRLKDPLKDLSITRTSFNWGIKLPIEKKHVFYVWVDALINYLTTSRYGAKNSVWPAEIHLIGVDIVWHHSVIWSSLLLSAGIELPKSIVVHGFIKVHGEKMAKSKGTVIDPLKLAENFSSDSVRYYLLREFPFGEDGNFSEEALLDRHNDLADSLGNLLNRVLTMVEKFGIVKKIKINSEEFDIGTFSDCIDKFEFHHALGMIFDFVDKCNRFINDNKPWENPRNETFYLLLENLRIISILISPFMPKTSERINEQLNIKTGAIEQCKFGIVKEYKTKKGEILFKKIKEN